MSSRPITSRLFASTCPTCRYQSRRTISLLRAVPHSKTAQVITTPPTRQRFTYSTSVSRWSKSARNERTSLSHLARNYATSSNTSAGSTPLKVIPPTIESLKTSEEFEDAELVPQEEAKLNVTEDAIRQLAKIASREPDNKTLVLRLVVESGGCHGYQYKMDLDDDGTVTGDYLFKPEIEPCVPIAVDIISLDLLKGSTLHFATELIGSSFQLKDNPQAKEGGNCGCGVSWEPK